MESNLIRTERLKIFSFVPYVLPHADVSENLTSGSKPGSSKMFWYSWCARSKFFSCIAQFIIEHIKRTFLSFQNSASSCFSRRKKKLWILLVTSSIERRLFSASCGLFNLKGSSAARRSRNEKLAIEPCRDLNA